MSEHRIDGTCRYEEGFTIQNFNKMVDGKVVIVIGVDYGMSKKMAQLMVERGAKVFVTARGEEKLDTAIANIKEKTGGDITEITADSSRPEGCKGVFEKTLEAHGDIDVLTNNASKGELITIDAVSDEVIDQVVDTNMKGPLYLCRETVRYFLKKDNGNIINISSVNGIRSMCGVAYCTTRGSLNALTKSVAIRCTGTGVHCNAIAPGHTPSPTAYAHDDDGPQTLIKRVVNEVCNTRTVRSVHSWETDQVYAVLFLASDMSRCINEKVLSVDYGCYLQRLRLLFNVGIRFRLPALIIP